MELIPIAEESLGVRSMAMFIRTKDLSILLDPGISLSPNRYGLPPHPRELERVKALRGILEKYAEEAKYVFISHYHRDHFTVPYPSIYMYTTSESYRKVYNDKVILMKSPEDENWSQKRRYYGLRQAVDGIAKDLVLADGKEFTMGSTRLVTSRSLPHGEDNAKTGKVIAITVIDGDESLTFMPDVEGPVSQLAIDYIMAMKPQTLVVGGPPIYLARRGFGEEYLGTALRSLTTIVRAGFLNKLVIAHHTLRDLNWRNTLRVLFEEADRQGISIMTYARLLNREDELLEAMRKELYAREPPPKDYLKQFRSTEDEA
ncbi:MBL fold metallo-hydrolase [Vulcanisaeta souniana]|uniref:UPF0282 protein GCM10007112_14490 n=1 Tax=Vulcanisaeta souniana JCM 11219 TaxID=1293586 RepID=A0A830EI32_9CREN|nr:hypothetical protein [Vulcanisaeta souniana]BDR93249.1 hypothetical protein Vsou_23420 [Vulcanisaeta souniana JCM 11219]GGI78760.1 hypothetical protein GCM10007112_14490 [Vulcanisaeta souniana JCM 11219]